MPDVFILLTQPHPILSLITHYSRLHHPLYCLPSPSFLAPAAARLEVCMGI
jgi:hypothetical protein